MGLLFCFCEVEIASFLIFSTRLFDAFRGSVDRRFLKCDDRNAA